MRKATYEVRYVLRSQNFFSPITFPWGCLVSSTHFTGQPILSKAESDIKKAQQLCFYTWVSPSNVTLALCSPFRKIFSIFLVSLQTEVLLIPANEKQYDFITTTQYFSPGTFDSYDLLKFA